MVVIAENWENPAGSTVDAEQLAEYVYHDLQEHKVGSQIDPSTVVDLKTHDPATFRNLSIAKIGRLVVDEVLYINVTQRAACGTGIRYVKRKMCRQGKGRRCRVRASVWSNT